VQIEGNSILNDNEELNSGDACEIVEEKSLIIQAQKKSHILFIELAN
jgi:hypothetical protein